MMQSFVYAPSSTRVIFGQGTISKLPEELERLALAKPLLLCTLQQLHEAEAIKVILKGPVAGIFGDARMHTPVQITERAVEAANHTGAGCIVSIGGGSTIGLGKAVSIRTGLYHITIPTTYAGSEVTPILGETIDGRKETRSDPSILPGTVIYDINLTLTLPVSMTVTSGINAIAHAVEALYARDSNPVIRIFAREGTKALVSALPQLLQCPESLEARSLALYGAWLCGTCLGSVGMSLHHKLCHTLGGSFNLPHSETHTIVLPHALAYNAPSVSGALEDLAEVIPGSQGGDPIKGLNLLLHQLKVDKGLKDYGMQEADIDKAADLAMLKPYWNPREITRPRIRELIRRAWAGEKARQDL